MSQLYWVIGIALGLLLLLSIIVSATLHHYIGGFIETVEREAREEEEREAAERETTGV